MDLKNIRIAVAGTGYVGLSIATLLSQHHQVDAVDVVKEKVDMINRRQSPIQDEYIEKYLAEKDLHLTATTDGASAYRDADFVVVATPTNYDTKRNFFDTSHVEEVIELVMKRQPQGHHRHQVDDTCRLYRECSQKVRQRQHHLRTGISPRE